MQSDKILSIMRKRGEKGISSEEIAKELGYTHVTSSSKIISQLRAAGHRVLFNKDSKSYTLVEKKESKKEVPAVEVSNTQGSASSSINPDEAKFFKISSKKDKILQYLIRCGKKGADCEELGKISDVSVKNVCFHIHALRRKDMHKITFKNGRYYIKGFDKNPLYNKGTKDLPVASSKAPGIGSIPDLEKVIGDKRLIRDISKIRPEDLPTYMDYLKKILYYTKCALAMFDTYELLDTLTIGDDQ